MTATIFYPKLPTVAGGQPPEPPSQKHPSWPQPLPPLHDSPTTIGDAPYRVRTRAANVYSSAPAFRSTHAVDAGHRDGLNDLVQRAVFRRSTYSAVNLKVDEEEEGSHDAAGAQPDRESAGHRRAGSEDAMAAPNMPRPLGRTLPRERAFARVVFVQPQQRRRRLLRRKSNGAYLPPSQFLHSLPLSPQPQQYE
ncbi:hypothetical protein FS837_004732 [Tulasnella sp. UAMH 9824]|nr:hypothetical protein FS837_004732 [Tulasnella sp. UAMH 9824]